MTGLAEEKRKNTTRGVRQDPKMSLFDVEDSPRPEAIDIEAIEEEDDMVMPPRKRLWPEKKAAKKRRPAKVAQDNQRPAK